MSKTCELCYGEVLDCENLYNMGYGIRDEWVCEQCFMDFAKEEHRDVCEKYCFVATSIADALGYDYKRVSKFSIPDFLIDHKIDELKGGEN